jgi:hypothetical protein
MTRCLILFLLASALLLAAEASPFVWIEAETPHGISGFEIRPDTRKPAICSAGACFFGSVPKDQFGKTVPTFSYDFEVAYGAEYLLWVRLGMEWVRAPLDWRIDGGEWKTYGETELTTSLMSVADWNELAWGRLALVKLSSGKHKLEVKFERPNKERLLFALDCFAFVSDTTWLPDGTLKPGERYDVDQPVPPPFALPEATGLGQRAVLDLNGTWQLARWDDPDMDRDPFGPVRDVPPIQRLNWMNIAVPGNVWLQRPELALASRVVYRATIRVPPSHAGRSAWIHFSGTNYVVSVFVNGVYCGGRRSILVPWDCDVSNALKPGMDNELLVVVKSHQYAMDLASKGIAGPLASRRNLPKSHYRTMKWNDAIYPSTKGDGDGTCVGIINPASLVLGGQVYTVDAFVRTSVARKRLDATLEIANPSGVPLLVEVRCAAIVDRTNAIAHEFPPFSLRLPQGGIATAEAGGEWNEAKLWWPSESIDDRPDCYRLRTTLLVDGKAIDIREDLFGFREISIAGRDFLLNGVPWRFNNWVDVPGEKTMRGPDDWLRAWHAQGDGFHRFSHDHSRFLGHREAAIATLDRLGVPSRCSTCIDGMFNTQYLGSKVLWKNWEDHLRQVIRAYRNHPSIMNWSIGNEVMLINSHNTRRKAYLEDEKQMARLIAVVKEMDPTRASYEDGAGDLGGAGEINNVHYSWQWWTDLPAQLYAYPTDPPAQRPGERKDTYRWDGKRPWMGGEEMYWAGRPGNVAWFGGPQVYSSNAEARAAASAYARMAIEGARWQGAAGIAPWTGPPTPDAIKAFARRGVFIREHNSCFAPGATFQRNVLIVNDSRNPGRFTLRWRLVFDGKTVTQHEKAYLLAPGQRQENRLVSILPSYSARNDGELELELMEDGKSVFTDTRPVSILPAPVPKPQSHPIHVFDPQGKILDWLAANKLTALEIKDPAALAKDAGTVLIGPQALSIANIDGWAACLRELVTQGGTAIILEQDIPLDERQLPAPLKMAGPEKKGEVMGEFLKQGGASGSICHPAAITHSVFDGLRPRDFRTWGGGEANYRLSYAVPAGSGVPLVVAGPGLKYAPMVELPIGSGSYLLSQVLIGSHLGIDPVADRLLANILDWAAERAATPPRPLTLVGSTAELSAALATIGADIRPADSIGTALAMETRLVVTTGTTEHLSDLAEAGGALDAFCSKGNWVLIVGLDQKAVSALDRLTGVTHRLRPFRTEGVRVAAAGDPVLMGLTDRDFSQRGYSMIAPWMGLYRVSKDVFSGVVDAGGDITAFSEGLPGQLTDGLRREDFWQYTSYFPSDGSQPVQIHLKTAESVAALEVWTSGGYYWPKDIAVMLDGDERHAIKKTLEADDEMQRVELPGKPVSHITINVLSVHDIPSSKDLVTFDEIRLVKSVSPELAAKQVALTNPAGLVKYPRGRGGLVLNMQRLDETAEPGKEAKELRDAPITANENRRKKMGILAGLVRNLGGSFVAIVNPAGPQTERQAPKKRKK